MTDYNDKQTTEIKFNIIKTLLKDEYIIRLIDQDYLETPEDLMYRNIFPYIKLKDDLEEDEEIYIGIGISYSGDDDKNDVYRNMSITFFILSHIKLMKTDGNGAVTDLIGDEILSIFNHREDYSFEFNLFSSDEGAYNRKYYYRQIVFDCVAQNNISNGVKNNRLRG